MTPSSFLRNEDLGRARMFFLGALGLACVIGVPLMAVPYHAAAYYAVLLACALPIYLWLRKGAPGLPLFPILTLLYIQYFAVPVLLGNITPQQFTPQEVFRTNLTVAGFIVMTTLTWWLVGFRVWKIKQEATGDPLALVNGGALTYFLYVGMGFNLVFQIGSMDGWLGWLGVFYSVLRAVILSATSVCFFLYGCALGSGKMESRDRKALAVLVALNMALQISTLFLYTAITTGGAALVGYVITRKKIPWNAIIMIGLAAGVLHVGKADMRQKYWNNTQAPPITSMRAPGLLVEWVLTSVNAVGKPRTGAQSLVDRASLLNQTLIIQQATPSTRPYLGGLTYAFLPEMLLPRFLASQKVYSQVTSNILGVWYGLQTFDSTATTAIGFGIVGEAFANFGYAGVAGAGIVFGLLIGLFSSIGIGAPLLSLRNILSIVAMLNFIQIEYDFGYLIVNLWQAVIAVTIFYYLLVFLGGNLRQAERPAQAPRPV